MEILKTVGKRLAALIDVKTIVTFAVTAVFLFLVFTREVGSDVAMSVVFTVIAFYFGTQKQKQDDKQQEKELLDTTESILQSSTEDLGKGGIIMAKVVKPPVVWPPHKPKINATAAQNAISKVINSLFKKKTGTVTATSSMARLPTNNNTYVTNNYGGNGYYGAQQTAPAPNTKAFDELRTNAQQAYEKNMQAVTEAYKKRADALNKSLNNQLAQLKNNYNFSKNEVDQQAGKAMQNAYVSMMMNQRDLPQLLAAQGISGGMSESSLVGLKNNYQKERNSVDSSRMDSFNKLLNTYQNNQSAARDQYNKQLMADEAAKMNAIIQLEQVLSNELQNIQAQQLAR